MFPIIKTLNDVLPFIKGNENFVHIVKDGYSVIDYVGANNHTFPNAGEHEHWSLFRECRGLIFNEEGKLISRPLRKGFNYGEKPDEDKNRSWDNVTITHKMDGSMIRPIKINGSWRLATRKGITDVAMMAETYLVRSGNWDKYVEVFNACADGIDGESFTPVFEFTSRENRVVLDYPEDSLTLLAIRSNDNGMYVPRESVYYNAVYRWFIPIVEIFLFPFEMNKSIESKITFIRELKNLEGIMVHFKDSQEMVKIKADDYCNLHRTKAYLDNERSVVACLVNDQADDLRPLLSPNQLIRFDAYEDSFWKGFHINKTILWDLIQEAREFSQDKKTYAVDFVNKQPSHWRPILFWLNKEGILNTIDIHEVNDCLKSFIKYNSQEAVNSCRWIFGAKW